MSIDLTQWAKELPQREVTRLMILKGLVDKGWIKDTGHRFNATMKYEIEI